MHLLRIIRGSPPVRPVPAESLLSLTLDRKRSRDDEPEETVDVISAQSLAVAAQRSGKRLLRDDLSIQRERIILFASE